MSGPKCAHVRPTPASRVTAALTEVERALLACKSPPEGTLAELLDDTTTWLATLRREASQYLKASGDSSRPDQAASKLQKLEQLREDLSLAISNEQTICKSLIEVEQASRSTSDAARTSLRQGGSTVAQLASMERDLRKAAALVDGTRRLAEQARRRIGRQRAELEAYHRYAHTVTANVGRTGCGDEVTDSAAGAKAAASEAARTLLRKQLAELAREPKLGWKELETWTGPGRPMEELRAMIRIAGELIESGDNSAAATKLERVAALRDEVERSAEAARGAAQRLRSVAEAVMQALYDRHYNMPLFGAIREGDPMSGIRIRADVPGVDGRGNIKIDLHVDGRADFEVENVPTGEEDLCRSVIGGLTEAVATEGLELEVTDWGRAAGVEPNEEHRLKKQEQVQQRRRGNSDGPRETLGGRP
jgi:hypothetical protein